MVIPCWQFRISKTVYGNIPCDSNTGRSYKLCLCMHTSEALVFLYLKCSLPPRDFHWEKYWHICKKQTQHLNFNTLQSLKLLKLSNGLQRPPGTYLLLNKHGFIDSLQWENSGSLSKCVRGNLKDLDLC